MTKIPQALFEVTPKLVGLWFLGVTETSDWLCGVTEVVPEEKYTVAYRFRYHKDDKVFDSKDRRSTYRVEATGSRAYVLGVIRLMASDMEKAGAEGKVEEILMHDGDTDRFVRELQEKPWAFMRVEGRIKP